MIAAVGDFVRYFETHSEYLINRLRLSPDYSRAGVRGGRPGAGPRSLLRICGGNRHAGFTPTACLCAWS